MPPPHVRLEPRALGGVPATAAAASSISALAAAAVASSSPSLFIPSPTAAPAPSSTSESPSSSAVEWAILLTLGAIAMLLITYRSYQLRRQGRSVTFTHFFSLTRGKTVSNGLRTYPRSRPLGGVTISRSYTLPDNPVLPTFPQRAVISSSRQVSGPGVGLGGRREIEDLELPPYAPKTDLPEYQEREIEREMHGHPSRPGALIDDLPQVSSPLPTSEMVVDDNPSSRRLDSP